MSQSSEIALTFHTTATVDRRMRINSLIWALWFLLVMGAVGLLGLAMVYSYPRPAFIAWLLFLAGIAFILYQPRYGIYLIIFLSLVGDKGLTYWYPFHLNFSSGESLLFLDSRLIFSPMEVYLVLTLLSWLVRGAILRRLRFYRGELFWPALVFMAFVVFGLVYGLGRGGDVNIGLWEARAIFYLPVMLVLTSNLITERGQFSTLMGLAVSALFIEGLVGVYYYFTVLKGDSSILAAGIMEHSAAIQMNTFFIFTLALWLYKGPAKARLFTLLMGIPVLFTFFMIQRRAAFLALLFALFFMAFILFRENRPAFWMIVPALTFAFVIYLVVFWNSTGSLGLLARAIKSQVAPQQSSLRDQASDIYRIIENYDIRYTLRQAPLTGIGFGHMFTMIIPLPDISFFVWYRYITHNSIGWIWMKTGIGGFVAMLFMVGLSIMAGIRTLFRLTGGMMSAIILTGTLYILMHFIYAYVDMSWDNQSMMYVGTMMGLISCAEKCLHQESD
jgi:hypothetical protein